MRMKRLVLAACAGLFCAADARALDPAPVFVSFAGSGKVRVQVADGIVLPCDSGENRILFDGTMEPNSTVATAAASDCVCLRHTSVQFPRTDWSMSRKYCRPRICRGRICRPAPDPTIRVQLSSF